MMDEIPVTKEPAEEDCPVPVRRLAAVAAAATPSQMSRFEPDKDHFAIAGALFESEVPPSSFMEWYTMAGLTKARFEHLIKDPAACAWVIGHSKKIAKFGLAACYGRLLHMALTSKNSAWMGLFLKRFDSEFDTRTIGPVHGDVYNFANMTIEELTAFLEAQRRRRYGASA